MTLRDTMHGTTSVVPLFIIFALFAILSIVFLTGHSEYSVEALFPTNSATGKLYEKLKGIILGENKELIESPRQNYVTFKLGKGNTVSLWPKDGWIEVVLNAKLGQINDNHGMIYDITNRKWSAAQYAFKFYDDVVI